MKKSKIRSININAISLGTLLASLLLIHRFANPTPVSAQTAGCGSGWSNTALKYLSPVGSNQFRVACNEHDACYDTPGKSKSECDKAFHNRMLGICSRDHNTWFGTPLRIACNGRADAYYTGVIEGAQDAYNTSQMQASARRNSSCSQNIIIRPHAEFERGQAWTSCSGYKLVFQGDGNLVVYNPFERPVWASNTFGRAEKLAMQGDGNLVLYGPGGPVWATGTDRRGGYLAIQSDGNVVIYTNSNQPIWHTGTFNR